MPRKKKFVVNNRQAAVAAMAATSSSHNKPAWLNECPLQDEDPLLDNWDQPSLAPGPALEACSGSDIYYQKASSKKQKYLAILPGLMAFNHHGAPKAARTSSTTTTATTTPKRTQDDDDEEEEEDSKPPATTSLTQETSDSMLLTQESNNSTAVASSSSAVTPAKASARKPSEANTLAMGQMRGLCASSSSSSDTTLTLPLDRNRQLEFRGHRVSTSSKFIVLTLQPKKGRVICKDVFSSAIVFGNPQEIVTDRTAREEAMTTAEDEKGHVVISSSADEIDDDDDHVSSSPEVAGKEEKAQSALEHYGGSCRAWDGSMQGKISNRTVPAVPSVKNKPPPVADDQPFKETVENDDDEEEDVKGNDSDEYQLDISSSPVVKRTAPRRQSRKPVKYKEPDGAESNEEEGGEALSVKNPNKAKEKSNQPLSDVDGEAKTGKSVPPRASRKTSTKQAAAGRPKKGDVSSEDDDDDDSSVEVVIPNSFNRSLRGEEDDEDFVLEHANPITNSKRPARRRVSSVQKRGFRKDRPDESGSEAIDVDELSEEDGENSKKSGRKLKKAKETSTPAASTGRRGTRKRRASSTDDARHIDQKPSSRKAGKVTHKTHPKSIANNTEPAASRKKPTSQDDDSSYGSNSDEVERETTVRPKSAQKSVPQSSTKVGVCKSRNGRNVARKTTAGSDGAMCSDNDPEKTGETDDKKESIRSAPRRRRRRAPDSTEKDSAIKKRAPINLSDGEDSIEFVGVRPSASKKSKKNADSDADEQNSVEIVSTRRAASKKTKKKLDSDSDASFDEASMEEIPVPRRRTGSTQKVRAPGAKSARQNKNDDGENADDTNQESDAEGLDGKSMKAMLAKAISEGKAARPSPAKPDVGMMANDASTHSPFGTPSGRRRRAPGKSPAKSASKSNIRYLADDEEYNFLD